MYFKGLTFIFSEDPPENHLMVIGGLLLKYYVLLFIIIIFRAIIDACSKRFFQAPRGLWGMLSLSGFKTKVMFNRFGAEIE